MKPLILSFLLLFLFFNGLKSQNTVDSTIQTFNYKKDFKSILMNSQDQESNLYYEKLLKRFQDNDSSLTNYETLALMIGFTENPKYKPMEDMKKEVEIFDHNNAGEFSEAIEKSKSFLNGHPLSLLVLREISYAYSKISKVYEKDMVFDSAIYFNGLSSYYMSLNDRIMEAMIFSGKGRAPENPIFSLGLADGEHFIPNVGYEIEKKNTLWNKNGDFLEHILALDKLTTKDFYFVIQHAKLKVDDDSEVKLDEQNHQIKNGKTKKQKTKSKEKTSPTSAAQIKNIVELPIQLSSSDSNQTQTALPVITDSTKNEKPKNKKSKTKEKVNPGLQNNSVVEIPIEMSNASSIQTTSTEKIESTKNSKPRKQKAKSKEKTNSAPAVQNKNDVEIPIHMPSSDSMQITLPVIMDSTKNGVDKVIQ